MAEEVKVKFGADTKEAEAGIRRVKDDLKTLQPAAAGIMDSFKAVGAGIVAAFSVRELSQFINAISELGEKAQNTSKMLGMTVEEVEKLRFVGSVVGVSTEGMTSAITRLERNMAEAKDTSSMAAKSFAALGISQKDIANNSPDGVLNLVANTFARTKDGAEKTAIAMNLMGRGGAQMIPVLNEGAAGLAELERQGQATGSMLSSFQAEALGKTNDKIDVFKASLQGAGISLVEVFQPAIDAVIDGLTTLVQAFRAVIEIINVSVQLMSGAFLEALAYLVLKYEEFSITISNVFNTIKLKAEEIATVLKLLVTGNLQAAVDAQKRFEKEVADGNKRAAEQVKGLGKEYEALKDKILAATEASIKSGLGIGGGKKEGDKPSLTTPTSGGGSNAEADRIAILKNNLQTELTINKLALQSRKDTDQAKVESGEITAQQHITNLKAMAKEEQQINLEAVNKQMAASKHNSVEYKTLLNQKKILTAQHNLEINRLNLQSIKLQSQQYNQIFGTIGSSFKGMLSGILQGTQTWRQAMGNLFSNLAMSFIDTLVIRPALAWAQGQLNKLLTAEATNAGILASDEATAIASHATMVAKNIATLTADGALTFAGQMAFLSPLMGPAAVGPAGAMQALVMAQLPAVSLDVGAWNLNKDTVAQLHKGEMVVPATFAQGLRDGGGSLAGGNSNVSVNFSVSAIDSRDMNQFFKENGGIIAKTVAEQMRNGNKSLNAALK